MGTGPEGEHGVALRAERCSQSWGGAAAGRGLSGQGPRSCARCAFSDGRKESWRDAGDSQQTAWPEHPALVMQGCAAQWLWRGAAHPAGLAGGDRSSGDTEEMALEPQLPCQESGRGEAQGTPGNSALCPSGATQWASGPGQAGGEDQQCEDPVAAGCSAGHASLSLLCGLC